MGDAVNAERLSLLSTLYNLELKTRDESYVTSSDDTQKNKKSNERREVIQPLLEKIRMLKDTILRLDDIPTRDDTSIYTFNTDFMHHTEYYRLYKKKTVYIMY